MTDRVNGYDGTYGIGYRYGWGDYLGDMSKFFTGSLAYCPGNIWNARNYTQAWNTYTYHAAQPYGFYLNYTGRPHYIVADPFEMPYQTALELHGYSNPGVPTAATTAAKLEMLTAQAGLEAKAGQVVYDLKDRAAIAQWKDAECLKDKPELKKEVEELAEKIENMLKKIYEAMENKEKLSMPEVDAKIDALIEASKPLKEQANELKEKLEKVYNEYNKKKAEEAAAKAREENDEKVDSEDKTPGADEGKTENEDYTPPEVKTSPEKTKITENGTPVKVKAKGGSDELTGKFYEYEGKIYKVTNGAEKPEDVTDQVEKITT